VGEKGNDPCAKTDCLKTCGTKGKSLFLKKPWVFFAKERDVFGPDAFSFHPHGSM
jgi:hypothetical protein